ncbi:hypothetical protein PTKIN_Ptkin02bG0159900 [Pterospermum kingtungense]
MRDDYDTFIKKNGWSKLAAEPERAVKSIVREFYANAKEHSNFEVFMSGKWVSFDIKAICAYFELPTEEEDEYYPYISDGLDSVELEKIIADIAKPGT